MRKLILFWLLLTGIRLQAQQFTQTLRGTVTESETKIPLPGASVILLNGEARVKGALTDSLGRFRFEEIPTGRYNVLVRYVGYEDGMQQNIVLNSGKEVVLNIPLRESVITTEEIKITATEKGEARNDMTTVSARQFTIEETMRYAGSWNDPSRMAGNFAGVSSADDSRNDIIIRGNSPAGLLWRLEGADIPNPNHFGAFGTTGGPVSMLNNNLLDNSDFMTGAWPAEYGNALGGVFDLRMRKGNDEQREFLGQFGFNGAELLAEGPMGKVGGGRLDSNKVKGQMPSYLISYRYSTLKLFHALGIRLGTSSQPTYTDCSFKLNFPSQKIGDISIFGIGGVSSVSILQSERDSADFFGPSGNDIIYGTKMFATGVNHFKIIGKNSWLKTTLSVSGGRQNTVVDRIDRITLEGIPFYRNNSAQGKGALAMHFNHKFSPRHSMRAGYFLNSMRFNLSDSVQLDSTNGFRVLSDFKGGAWLLQPYVEYKFRINSKLTFNGGMYYQLFTLNNTGSMEPRLGLRWDFSKKQSLSFAVGQHSQLQPMYVYFAEELQPDSTYSRKNQNLGMTKSRQAVLGYDLRLGAHMRIKAETYYQHLYNVPVNVGDSGVYSMLNEGADYYFVIPDSLENTGTGRNYGFEITLERFFHKNFYFLLTGTLYDSKYTGGDGILRNTRFNGKFTLHALGGVQFNLGEKKRWITGFDGRISWAGGKFYTPLDEIASTALSRPVYQDDIAYTVQFPDYFRLDVRAKIRLNSKKVSQELAIDITNILGRQNVLNQVYDYPTNTLKFNYQLGLFPVGQYRIEF